METEDVSSMMEKMRMMSSMFGNDQPKKENDNSMENMLKIMELMKILNTNNRLSENRDTKELPVKNAEKFDDNINSPALNRIKACIPYLDHKYQRDVGVFIKILEIQRLVEYYDKQSFTREDEDWRKGMLIAMQPHISAEKQELLSKMIKLFEIKNILNSMQ